MDNPPPIGAIVKHGSRNGPNGELYAGKVSYVSPEGDVVFAPPDPLPEGVLFVTQPHRYPYAALDLLAEQGFQPGDNVRFLLPPLTEYPDNELRPVINGGIVETDGLYPPERLKVGFILPDHGHTLGWFDAADLVTLEANVFPPFPDPDAIP